MTATTIRPDRCWRRFGIARRRHSRQNSKSANGTATVTREVDIGLETIEVDLTGRGHNADLRLNEPRYVKLPDIMKAKKKPLDEIALSDLNIADAPADNDRCV